jgi:hypothetical protein
MAAKQRVQTPCAACKEMDQAHPIDFNDDGRRAGPDVHRTTNHSTVTHPKPHAPMTKNSSQMFQIYLSVVPLPARAEHHDSVITAVSMMPGTWLILARASAVGRESTPMAMMASAPRPLRVTVMKEMLQSSLPSTVDTLAMSPGRSSCRTSSAKPCTEGEVGQLGTRQGSAKRSTEQLSPADGQTTHAGVLRGAGLAHGLTQRGTQRGGGFRV